MDRYIKESDWLIEKGRLMDIICDMAAVLREYQKLSGFIKGHYEHVNELLVDTRDSLDRATQISQDKP